MARSEVPLWRQKLDRRLKMQAAASANGGMLPMASTPDHKNSRDRNVPRRRVAEFLKPPEGEPKSE